MNKERTSCTSLSIESDKVERDLRLHSEAIIDLENIMECGSSFLLIFSLKLMMAKKSHQGIFSHYHFHGGSLLI